jgi:hypothetical protein
MKFDKRETMLIRTALDEAAESWEESTRRGSTINGAHRRQLERSAERARKLNDKIDAA